MTIKDSCFIVAVVDSVDKFNNVFLEFNNHKYDIIEMRLDLLTESLIKKNLNILAQFKFPIIATFRHHSEGGNLKVDEKTRIEYLSLVLPYIKYLDIEIYKLKTILPLLSELNKFNIQLINSYHNFDKTPSIKKLEKVINQSLLFCELENIKNLVIKIATKFNKPTDINNLLKCLRICRKKNIPISVMGMGEYGKASRLYLAKSGSILNYCYLGEESSVKGQWSSDVFYSLIN